jgi:hypothetical protein
VGPDVRAHGAGGIENEGHDDEAEADEENGETKPGVAPEDERAQEEEVALEHRRATTDWPWQSEQQGEAEESAKGATWLLVPLEPKWLEPKWLRSRGPF